MQLNQDQANVMNSILTETSQGKPFYVTQEQGMQLAQAGFITVNPGATDPNNPKAMSAIVTENGQAALTNYNTQLAQANAAAAQPAVEQPVPAQAAPVATEPVQAAPTEPVQAAPVQTAPVTQPVAQSQAAPVQTQPMQQAPATTAPATATAATNSIQASQSTRTEFQVLSNVPKPPRAQSTGNTGGGGRKSKYPYESLEIGQCFFVADSDYPGGDAHKAIASSVAAANRRHRVPKIIGYENNQPQYQIQMKDGQPVKAKDGSTKFVTINTKRFRSYKTDANHPSGAGALVYREALKETDVQAAPVAAAPQAQAQPVAQG